MFRDIHIECSKQFKWNLYFMCLGIAGLFGQCKNCFKIKILNLKNTLCSFADTMDIMKLDTNGWTRKKFKFSMPYIRLCTTIHLIQKGAITIGLGCDDSSTKVYYIFCSTKYRIEHKKFFCFVENIYAYNEHGGMLLLNVKIIHRLSWPEPL